MTATAKTSSTGRVRRAWAPEASVEVAQVLRLLMARPWLIAGRDDDAIAAVRRNLPAVRDTIARLGWVLVVERDVVRLRKSPPARRDAFAAGGPSPRTCQWFFLLVAAAESMGRKTSLGALVTAARSAGAEAGIDCTEDLIERRAIVAGLKMLTERGVIEELDGNLEGYVQDEQVPVLLAVHHNRLLHVIANFTPEIDPADDPQGWLDAVEREPDAARRMRRRLVDDTVVHTGDLDEAEAAWLRQRSRGDDGGPLAAAFGLHLERRAEGAAFVVPDDAYRHPWELGPFAFPAAGTVAHAAHLLCERVLRTTIPDDTGWRVVPVADVEGALTEFAAEQTTGTGGWSRELAEDPSGRLLGEVRQLLAALDLTRTSPEHDQAWRFSPAIARWEAAPAPTPPRPARASEAASTPPLDFGASQ